MTSDASAWPSISTRRRVRVVAVLQHLLSLVSFPRLSVLPNLHISSPPLVSGCFHHIEPGNPCRTRPSRALTVPSRDCLNRHWFSSRAEARLTPLSIASSQYLALNYVKQTLKQ